jgi:hypothetical protein
MTPNSTRALHELLDQTAPRFPDKLAVEETETGSIRADPTAPATRNAIIFHDCAVKVLIVQARLAEALRSEVSQVGFAPEMVVLDGTGAGVPLTNARSRPAGRRQPSFLRAQRSPRVIAIGPTSSTLRDQPVGRKVSCCRTLTRRASLIGVPTCFNQASAIGFIANRRSL